MEFEYAAKRLERDQAKYRGRGSRGGPVLSVKAKRQAEYRKKQQEKARVEKEKKKQQLLYIQSYFNACERKLGVKTLQLQGGEDNNTTTSLRLQPTSIYGDGDKISLPPSVLQFLSTNTMMGAVNGGASSPWIFRIGILNPNYDFPSSKQLQSMTVPREEDDDEDEDRDVVMGDKNNDSDDDDEDGNNALTPYLKELKEKYISYTHGTVVEFTQEDGYIGLPKLISSALLSGNKKVDEEIMVDDENNNDSLFQIPVTRTVDPSTITTIVIDEDDGDHTKEEEGKEEDNDGHDEETTKTPGHIAYGNFDIPDMKIEINLIKLPKGSGCTLVPTRNAIQNGFYNLKDVKLVLEQSLIRTRATLSIGDTVYTWHRGIQFDLIVSDVSPSTFHAISCINTDIEVIIGENESITKEQQEQEKDNERLQQHQKENNKNKNDATMPSSGGYTLAGGSVSDNSSSNSSNNRASEATTQLLSSSAKNLIEEPPIDQKEGVCTVQIRTPNGRSNGRRRFDIHKATIHNLFTFVLSLLINDESENTDNNNNTCNSFRLVTRYPRRIFSYDNQSTTNNNKSLANAGIKSVQELFMVEEIL